MTNKEKEVKRKVDHKNKNDIEKIKEVIDKLRPFLITDGGNIEFVNYEEGIVYIKMLGACAGCELIDYTLKDGVESAIRDEVPSVKEVINVTGKLID